MDRVGLFNPHGQFAPDTAETQYSTYIQQKQKEQLGLESGDVGLEFMDWEGKAGTSGTHSKDKLLVNVLLGYVWLEIGRLKET